MTKLVLGLIVLVLAVAVVAQYLHDRTPAQPSAMNTSEPLSSWSSPAVSRAGSAELTSRLVGTKWEFASGKKNYFSYEDGGRVMSPGLTTPREWHAINAHTIIQQDRDQSITITYDDAFQHALCVYEKANPAILIKAQ